MNAEVDAIEDHIQNVKMIMESFKLAIFTDFRVDFDFDVCL